jgi:C4-dicarboxylate-specific signal transduction histidine kinase
MPRDCPPTQVAPTIIEVLFDSQAMLLVGRLLIVVAAAVLFACAVFLLVSMVVRMRQGHWLKRAGPFEISESLAGAVDQRTQVLTDRSATQESQITELEVLLEALKRSLADQENGDS